MLLIANPVPGGTCTSGAAGVQQHEESNSTNLPDFLSEDYVFANVLNNMTNYEAHQNSVLAQNLSQNAFALY
jgi:hypothetical protein